MEITDINCMLGDMPQRLHFTDAAGLFRAMEDYRITRAVAYHADARWDAWRGNAAARAAAEGSGGRLQACYLLRPNLGGGEMPDAAALLQRLRAERPAAVRLSPASDGCPLNRFYYGEVLEVLQTLRLPLLLDFEQRMVAEFLPEVTRDFPQIPFIVLRSPFRQTNVILPLLRQRENVSFDTCTLVDTGFVEEIVARCGSRQLLFGSGMPMFLPAGALGLVRYARIPADDQAGIFAGNWQALQEAVTW